MDSSAKIDIPVPEGTFDAAYAIEATCHAPDRVGVYSQVSFTTLSH
jgi:sterol 24-C-methyltransferase